MNKSAGKRKGGLKSALVSLQSRGRAQSKAASAKEAQEKKGKALQRKIAGQGPSKQLHRTTQLQPVPFVSPWDNTLLIGEGNFSFALSLVEHHGIPGHRIIATAYDTEEQLLQKYPEVQDNLRILRERGVTVILHVDARALQKNKPLVAEFKRLGGFSCVVWNFPHAGAGIQDQDRNIHVNQQLLLEFFQSVASFLSTTHDVNLEAEVSKVGDGEDSDVEKPTKQQDDARSRVLITLRDSAPYTLWEVPKLAKRPPLGHVIYQQLRSYVFEPSAYPGYEHRRTIGGGTVPLLQDGSTISRTWEFVLRD